ncbi:MAG: alpha-glucan family phosphorylase [Pyrinomonadaceae bacterium]
MDQLLTKDISEMRPAARLQPDQTFNQTFSLECELPENLNDLERISNNFFWSWNSEGTAIFRDLSALLWEKYEQNPRRLLKEIGDLQLWQKACEPGYVERVKKFAGKLDEYLAKPKNTFGIVTPENPVAYFCAEYGVHNSLPIYSGGLGILSGDHLKSASDMNVPLVAVGLFYRFGYFRQKIAHDGWQEERYLDSFENKMALQPVFDEAGERVSVMIHMRGREVHAQAWLAQIGRISLYLLDTNVEQNSDVDRLITGHLYGGDTETRIVQEKILGIGGVRLLRKLGVQPSVYHLNEGHSAFLTLELAREILESDESLTFEDAVSKVCEKCVFTTHTPVAAGNDSFAPELIEACFDKSYIDALKISKDALFALGRTVTSDSGEWFGMTPLALRMTRSANGVSEKHGEVSRDLWLKMFPEGTKSEEVPITFVTNGVHAPTWIAPILKDAYEKNIGADWTEVLKDETAWKKALDRISDKEIWKTHRLLKQNLIAFVRQRTLARETGSHNTINEHRNTDKFFDPEILTIGFARRVAEYKRWNLLLSDPERLLRMIDNAENPVQFVFAGKAHPQDRSAKFLLQNLMNQKQNETWFRRAVFIEDYDQEVARFLVRGVDVWMNVPRRPLEASGTSGQKVAMNGGLNFSILDGWWIEGYDGENGFSIGVLKDEYVANEHEIDLADAESLYQVLENEIIPAYYKKDENDLPTTWIAKMRRALETLTPRFSSDRMLRDYIEQIYN